MKLIMTNKIIPKKKTQIEKILAKQREEVVKRITEWRERNKKYFKNWDSVKVIRILRKSNGRP